MTWTRLSDDYYRRAAVMTLSRSARLLDAELLVWCNAQTTDGRLPEDVLRGLTDSPDPEADMAELLASGIWKRTKNGYKRDWSDQRTKAEVEKVREENAERQRRGRETQRQRETKHAAGDHSMCRAEYCSAKAGGESPQPSRQSKVGAGYTTVVKPKPKSDRKPLPFPDETVDEYRRRVSPVWWTTIVGALRSTGLYQDDQEIREVIKTRLNDTVLDWTSKTWGQQARCAPAEWLAEPGEWDKWLASERERVADDE